MSKPPSPENRAVFDAASEIVEVPAFSQRVDDAAAVLTERELLASLSAVSDVLGSLGDDDDDYDLDGRLDADLVARLEQITGAENVSLEFASLHRRVHDGLITWEQFWADPGAQPGGILIFGEVMRASIAEAEPVLQQLREATAELERRPSRGTSPSGRANPHA